MFREDASQRIEEELARGEAARREGFEGRARVCARRAAGAAIREYLELRGEPLPGTSAMDLLNDLQARQGLPAPIQRAVTHLLTQVNEAFALPEAVDLLAEARLLARELEALAG